MANQINDQIDDPVSRYTILGRYQINPNTNLQLFGAPGGRCLRDHLQLLDAIAEVRHPLDHSHGSRDGVARPGVRQDTLETNACCLGSWQH